MEEQLEHRIKKARHSAKEAEKLLEDYLPFIKKNVITIKHGVIEYDDCMTIAMMAFLQSIQTYEVEKGNFLSYASMLIHHQILDAERKEIRYSSKVELYDTKQEEENPFFSADDKASIQQYTIQLEQRTLAEEIDSFSKELEDFGIAFLDLPKVCPKRKTSRKLCTELAEAILKEEELRDSFFKHHRIPQAQIAKKFQISIKTIEKYRKYIAAVVILMKGDYNLISTFIPNYKGKQNA